MKKTSNFLFLSIKIRALSTFINIFNLYFFVFAVHRSKKMEPSILPLFEDCYVTQNNNDPNVDGDHHHHDEQQRDEKNDDEQKPTPKTLTMMDMMEETIDSISIPSTTFDDDDYDESFATEFESESESSTCNSRIGASSSDSNYDDDYADDDYDEPSSIDDYYGHEEKSSISKEFTMTSIDDDDDSMREQQSLDHDDDDVFHSPELPIRIDDDDESHENDKISPFTADLIRLRHERQKARQQQQQQNDLNEFIERLRSMDSRKKISTNTDDDGKSNDKKKKILISRPKPSRVPEILANYF
mgnify:CR=1 FL=1